MSTPTTAPTAAPEADDTETTGRKPPRRHRRRVRRFLVLLLCVALGYGIATLTGPAEVSQFRSEADRDRYLAAYDRAMEDLPEPEEVRDVATSFGTVRVYRFQGAGTGTPIVALPGTRSGVPVLADNLPGLLEHRPVYAMDLLGEPGHSVQSAPISTPADQASWLDQTLDGLPEDRFHLVGISIGGWTSANLAVRDPAHVASVTLIDSPNVVGGLSAGAIVRSIPISMPFAPRSWRDSFSSWTAGGARVEDVPVADMIEAGMSTFDMNVPSGGRIDEDDLRDLEVPTMMVVAGDSPLHDPEKVTKSGRELLDTVHVYEGASHAVNGEEPERIARDIGAFVDRHEG